MADTINIEVQEENETPIVFITVDENSAQTSNDAAAEANEAVAAAAAILVEIEDRVASTSFRGSIELSSLSPVESGFYFPIESGLYSNFGGLEVDLSEGITLITFDGTLYAKQVIPVELSDYYNISQSKDNYLNILNLITDGVVPRPTHLKPYNKSAEVFTTGSNLGTSAAYYEINNKVLKSNNEVLKKIHVYSTGAGTINLLFGRITGGLGFIDYTLPKTVVAGWNVFTFSDGDIPSYITDLSEYLVAANNVTTGLMKFKATPAGTLSVFGINTSGGTITATTNTLGMYLEVQEMNKTVLEFYPETKQKLEDLLNFNGTTGFSSIPSQIVNSALYTSVSSYLYAWCDEKAFITNGDAIKELVLNTTTAGSFTFQIINVVGNDYTVVHSYTGSAVTGINRFSATAMAIPDLSSYSRLYCALKNNSASTGVAPLRTRSTAESSYCYRFNQATMKVDRFLNTLEFNFYLNIENPVYDKLSTEVLKVQFANDGVSNYNQLIDALSKNDAVKISRGIHTFSETILLPPNKKLYGEKGAILKPGTGVKNLIYITGKGQSVDGLTIDMGGAVLDFYGSTQISTGAQLETLTNIGDLIGIYAYECQDVNIEKVTVKNATHSGFLLEKSGDIGGLLTTPRFREGVNLNKSTAENCYFGFRGGSGFQYSRLSDLNGIQCIAGISLTYGNIAVVNSHFTQCRVGAHVGAGGNDGHGNFTGCFFNHNTLYGSYATNLLYGMVFNGCQWFEGIIGIKNSLGITINGGIIASAIEVDLSVNQLAMIKNVMFRTNGVAGSGTVTKTGLGKLVMAENEFWNAGTNVGINGIF